MRKRVACATRFVVAAQGSLQHTNALGQLGNALRVDPRT